MDGWTKHHSERPPKNSAAEVLTNPVHWSHISSVYVLLDGDDGPDEAPSSTRCAAACSWRFPRSGSALLCGRDGSHAKLHTSREGSQMQERRSKKERWKEIQRFFPNRSPSGLEGGGAVSLMKTSVWGVAQGCYLQQKRKLKKCGTFFLPDERPSRNHTNDQCIENHFQLDNQTQRASGESSVEKDRGVLTGPQHPFKKKKWSVKVQLDFTSWGIYRRSRLHFCL